MPEAFEKTNRIGANWGTAQLFILVSASQAWFHRANLRYPEKSSIISNLFQLVSLCSSIFHLWQRKKTWSYTKQKLTKPPPNLLNSYFASNLSTKQFCWPVKYRMFPWILPPILLANDLSRTPFLWPLKEIPPLDVLGKSWQSWSKNNHLNLIA